LLLLEPATRDFVSPESIDLCKLLAVIICPVHLISIQERSNHPDRPHV
jgi:hypothetical protein